jgi:hypothetical protein
MLILLDSVIRGIKRYLAMGRKLQLPQKYYCSCHIKHMTNEEQNVHFFTIQGYLNFKSLLKPFWNKVLSMESILALITLSISGVYHHT